MDSGLPCWCRATCSANHVLTSPAMRKLNACLVCCYLIFYSKRNQKLLHKFERKARPVSTEVIPGSGQDGPGPFRPVPGDGFAGENEDAWAARLMAEADADEAWVDAEC